MAYKKRSELHWYAVILFLPILGCLIYCVHLVNRSYRIKKFRLRYFGRIFTKKSVKKLKNKLDAENNFMNKIALGEAYLLKKDYSKALEQFQNALKEKKNQDHYAITKIIECYYHLNEFDKVTEYFHKTFINSNNSETLFYYGVALEKQGKLEYAENILQKINIKYANYFYRLELSKFLIRVDKKNSASMLLNEIIDEIDNMMKTNFKKNKKVYLEAKALVSKI